MMTRKITSNVLLNEHKMLYMMTIDLSPTSIDSSVYPKLQSPVLPGQFVTVKQPNDSFNVLARPFAIYDYNEQGNTLSVIYQQIGCVTSKLATFTAKDYILLSKPRGNHFGEPYRGNSFAHYISNAKQNNKDTINIVVMIGGIGVSLATSVAKYFLAETKKHNINLNIELIYGEQNQNRLILINELAQVYSHLHLTFDNPLLNNEIDQKILPLFTQYSNITQYYQQFPTTVLNELITKYHKSYDLVMAAGPTPMLRSVVKLAKTHTIPIEVSLENMMACGVGACLSCVEDIKLVPSVDCSVDNVEVERVSVCNHGPIINGYALCNF